MWICLSGERCLVSRVMLSHPPAAPRPPGPPGAGRVRAGGPGRAGGGGSRSGSGRAAPRALESMLVVVR